jgi:hypothetical protein
MRIGFLSIHKQGEIDFKSFDPSSIPDKSEIISLQSRGGAASEMMLRKRDFQSNNNNNIINASDTLSQFQNMQSLNKHKMSPSNITLQKKTRSSLNYSPVKELRV